MAKAGSCKIGFNPNPSSTTTEFTRNGFEVKMTKREKIMNRPLWIFRTLILKVSETLLKKE